MRNHYRILTGIYIILMSVLLFFLVNWTGQKNGIFILTIIYYIISIVEFISLYKSKKGDVYYPVFIMLFLNLLLKMASV